MPSDPVATVQGIDQTRLDLDQPLALHPLVYLVDGDEVTVGRRDIDSYGIFPPEGAEIVRKLAAGATPRQVADWFSEDYGEMIEIEEVIAGLAELEFLVQQGDQATTSAPVPFARLGAAMFSPAAWMVYVTIIVGALVAMAKQPDLIPNYHRVFFTDYYTVIQVALFISAIPMLLLHESFHALAGRRLGLRSRLRIDRRMYFIILETSLDGLVTVARRKRYLPILAGLLADAVGVSVCVLLAAASRSPDGSLPLIGRFLLAVAFGAVLRMVWQFFFYLRTDIYVLVSTVLGCVDLHSAAKQVMANRFNRVLGRTDRIVDESRFHPVDRRAARWYCWLIMLGYPVSIITLLTAGLPVLWKMTTDVLGRFTADDVSNAQLWDSILFSAGFVAQLLILAILIVRDRRRRKASAPLQSVISYS
ncbi:MAG: hypothetical protein M3173_07970 [Chloroflexota bacterium]|nr:hypothetical protein [Chloroflexota bacterium]